MVLISVIKLGPTDMTENRTRDRSSQYVRSVTSFKSDINRIEPVYTWSSLAQAGSEITLFRSERMFKNQNC